MIAKICLAKCLDSKHCLECIIKRRKRRKRQSYCNVQKEEGRRAKGLLKRGKFQMVKKESSKNHCGKIIMLFDVSRLCDISLT